VNDKIATDYTDWEMMNDTKDLKNMKSENENATDYTNCTDGEIMNCE
jgi:hypothetical protein